MYKRIAVIFFLLLFIPVAGFGDQVRTTVPRGNKQEGLEKKAIQEEKAPENLESTRIDKTKDNNKRTTLIRLLQALHLSR
jgi:hypothetical protein